MPGTRTPRNARIEYPARPIRKYVVLVRPIGSRTSSRKSVSSGFLPILARARAELTRRSLRAVYAVFSQTETCSRLSLVKDSRFQVLQRSRKVMPASRAIRSNSDGQT